MNRRGKHKERPMLLLRARCAVQWVMTPDRLYGYAIFFCIPTQSTLENYLCHHANEWSLSNSLWITLTFSTQMQNSIQIHNSTQPKRTIYLAILVKIKSQKNIITNSLKHLYDWYTFIVEGKVKFNLKGNLLNIWVGNEHAREILIHFLSDFLI